MTWGQILAEIGGPVVIVSAIWRAKGWVDNLNENDRNLAKALHRLDETQKAQHRDNQRRLAALERRIGSRNGDLG